MLITCYLIRLLVAEYGQYRLGLENQPIIPLAFKVQGAKYNWTFPAVVSISVFHSPC